MLARLAGGFRSPRGLLVFFTLLTVAPAVGLVFTGWTLVEQQKNLVEQARALEEQRARVRLEQGTELIVTAFDQQQRALLQKMADVSGRPALSRGGGRLIVLGAGQRLPEAAPALFEAGEALEYQQDFASAMSAFRTLAGSTEPATQAGALLRLARVQRKAERLPEALETYRQLAQLSEVSVADGRPADLVGLHMQGAMATQLRRYEELRRNATTLRQALRQGRWSLDAATYSMYDDDLAAWLGEAEDGVARPLREVIHEQWRAWESGKFPGSGFEGQRLIGSGSVVLFWRADGPHLVLLAVESPSLQQRWLAEVEPLLQSQRVTLSFVDEEAGGLATRSTGTDRFERTLRSTDTHLPWTMYITGTMDTSSAITIGREVLLAASALLLAVVAAGSYFVARAVHRELSVARLQSDFVAAVSHEFRTPLTSLRQITEILIENRVADTSRIADYNRKQLRATERLRRLVETLLDFGRMEAGSRPYRLAPLDVSQWIRGVVGDFQTESPGTHAIQLQASDDACMVEADAEALAHAVRNLLDNAVKYSPQHDTVRVTVGMRGSECAIGVRDEGLGILPSEQKDIWKKFVRGSAAHSNAIRGTGVGLAMVRYIVDAHHGRIQLQSHPGQGSTFTLLLPASGES